MWKSYWKLARDPFLDPGSPYVPTPTHEEAVARLVHTIETGQRQAVLRAAEGLGKSRVLMRALTEMRGPTRRLVRVVGPADGAELLARLAEGLGIRFPRAPRRSEAWRALGDAVRLCRWQRLQVVLAIDDCQHLDDPADRLDLARLVHLDPHPETRLTVLTTRRPTETDDAPPPWDLSIRLVPLTRTQAEHFITAKLAAAGRPEPTFTPRALTRLHALARGVPRGLDRLASLALMAGASRALEILTPDVIDGVALECTAPT